MDSLTALISPSKLVNLINVINHGCRILNNVLWIIVHYCSKFSNPESEKDPIPLKKRTTKIKKKKVALQNNYELYRTIQVVWPE